MQTRLGIRIIAAHSPQAKGRVERNHGVYQDRFVKELSYLKINNIEKANELLQTTFIDHLNQRFAVKAASAIDGHRPLLATEDLHELLSFESIRRLQQDGTFSYQNHYFQLIKPLPCFLKSKAKLIIRNHLDHSMSVWYQGIKLLYQKITKAEKIYVAEQTKSLAQANQAQAKERKKTKSSSPWRQYNEHWLSGAKRTKQNGVIIGAPPQAPSSPEAGVA